MQQILLGYPRFKGGFLFVKYLTSLMPLHCQARNLKNSLFCFYLFLTALFLVAQAQATTSPPSDPRAVALQAYLNARVADFNVPGAAVAVVSKQELLFSEGFGQVSLDSLQMVNAGTRFMIGSVTKSMTSALLGMLKDEGLADWDYPLSDCLPELMRQSHSQDGDTTLQLHHLLSHTSGMARLDIPLFLERRHPLDWVRRMNDIAPINSLGTTYEYQNQMFSFAGLCAARLAAMPQHKENLLREYARLLNKRLFKPLGMRSSTLSLKKALRGKNTGLPHTYDNQLGQMASMDIGWEAFASPVAPAGAVWSTANDMSRYLQWCLASGALPNGEQLLAKATVEELQSGVIPLDDLTSVGYGWFTSDFPFGKIIEHGGGTAGFNSQVMLLPEQDLGLVILTNRAGAGYFIQAVVRKFLELYLGFPPFDDEGLIQAAAEYEALLDSYYALSQPPTAEQRQVLSGRYKNNKNSRIKLFSRDGDLFMRGDFGEMALRQIPVLPEYPCSFIAVGNTPILAVNVSQNESGDIELLLDGADTVYRHKAQPLETPICKPVPEANRAFSATVAPRAYPSPFISVHAEPLVKAMPELQRLNISVNNKEQE